MPRSEGVSESDALQTLPRALEMMLHASFGRKEGKSNGGHQRFDRIESYFGPTECVLFSSWPR